MQKKIRATYYFIIMHKVGSYIIEKEIAIGSYGTVSLCHNETNEKFAIKKIQIQQKSMNLLTYIDNEITTLSQIANPNVVRFIEALRSANNFYIVMEFCKGRDLASYLSEFNNIPFRIVSKWMRKILIAFVELRGKNIVHRDIKPGNLLLTENNIEEAEVKIADFGFAKILKSPMIDTQVGTPLYMAPEVIAMNQYNYKSDIWSLGVTAYELLYGYPPFQCSQIEELKNLQRAEITFNENPNVPIEAVEFIKAMLVFDYNQRPGFDQLLEMQFVKEQVQENPMLEIGENKEKEIQVTQKAEIQNILQGYEDQKNEISQCLMVKVAYIEVDRNIEYLALRYALLGYQEIHLCIDKIIPFYESQKDFVEKLKNIMNEVMEIGKSYEEELKVLDEEVLKKVGFQALCNSLVQECEILMKNPDDHLMTTALILSKIGKKIFMNIPYFGELYLYLKEFETIHNT